MNYDFFFFIFYYLDYVGYYSFSDDLLTTHDILLSTSIHQQLMELNESYIGIIIIWLSLIHLLFIPTIANHLANIIIIYLFGIFGLFIIIFTYIFIIGWLFIAMLLYFFISSNFIFITIIGCVEWISLLFNSITLTNRLSINIIAGGFLITILFHSLDLLVLIEFYLFIDYSWLLILIFIFIFLFESLAVILQLLIFIILCTVIIIYLLYLYYIIFILLYLYYIIFIFIIIDRY